ncbi:MAG: hypothetical protein ACRDCB_12540 [Clostridium sp.]|uniref:hypothetical protein n=1 Tax=Clostridium TaxID=1485 RepID=UPI0021536648|nr:hypothetical protein [Clostridium sp. LY3-2]MCR6514335.1 hypothetical protein [Clostridium sp. LY3-2]
MKPLNYAILKHFTKVHEASVMDVMEALKDDYQSFKTFNKESIIDALLTAEANGLIEETRVDLDQNEELLIFYHANEESKATINGYIRD